MSSPDIDMQGEVTGGDFYLSFELLLGMFVPTMLLFFSGIFALLWFRERKATHVLAISCACLAADIGFVLSQFVIDKASILNVLLGQSSLLVAVSLGVWAVCVRAGSKVPVKLLAALSAFGVAAACWATAGYTSLNLRSFANDITLGALCAVGTYCLFRVKSKKMVDRLLFGSFFGMTAQFFAVACVAMFVSPPITGDNYHGSVYWVAINLSGGISILAMAGSLVTACVLDTLTKTIELSQIDPLTGLKTRRAFDDAVANTFAKIGRTPLPVSLIIGDIDHFKQVNDTYGHQAGDEVISAFGRLLNESKRESDIAGRVGGEEFAILLWNSHAAGARLIAESIRTAFACNSMLKPPSDLSASFGIAELQDGESFKSLYRRADEALYEAKRTGRNRVVAADSPPSCQEQSQHVA